MNDELTIKTALTDIALQEEMPLRLTDTSNAEKIAEMFGNKIRFDHRRKRWLVWQGHRWQPDNDGAINRMAIEAARKRYIEAIDLGDRADRKKASDWAIQSESKMRLDASMGLAKNLLPIADTGDNWDQDTMLLSCKNGIIDLRTGQLRDGKPEDRVTMQASIEYNPDATAPRWEQFIYEVFEENLELVHYVHKALGYSITGSTREQVAFFCFGTGSNGKSVLFKTIREILGDYAYDAPASLFQRNAQATNSNDVASTEFKRFLVSSETLSTSKLNEQRLKGWTGGDTVTARYLYSEYFSFNPTVKPWLFINHKPQVEDDSYGFWRRVRLIPFNRVFQGADADRELPEKLRAEAKGIFAWLVQGCAMWQQEGLDPTPQIISTATQVYQQENDALAEFIATKCDEQEGVETKASELFKAYDAWAEEQRLTGKDKLLNTAFGRRMGDKYQKVAKRDGNYYRGIMLRVGACSDALAEGSISNLQNPLYKENENTSLKMTPNPPPEHWNATEPSTPLNGKLSPIEQQLKLRNIPFDNKNIYLNSKGGEYENV